MREVYDWRGRTPPGLDRPGTRMGPLDRAPLRQRINGIVLSTSSQGSSHSPPPPAPLSPSAPSSRACRVGPSARAWQGWWGREERVSSPLRGRGDTASTDIKNARRESAQRAEQARLRAVVRSACSGHSGRLVEHERALRALGAAGSQRERGARVSTRRCADKEARGTRMHAARRRAAVHYTTSCRQRLAAQLLGEGLDGEQQVLEHAQHARPAQLGAPPPARCSISSPDSTHSPTSSMQQRAA